MDSMHEMLVASAHTLEAEIRDAAATLFGPTCGANHRDLRPRQRCTTCGASKHDALVERRKPHKAVARKQKRRR